MGGINALFAQLSVISRLSSGMSLSHLHMKFIACCLLQQRQHIIILSAYEHSHHLQQTSCVKLILTQVLVSPQALTSSFGCNYVPRSGILSTFVTEAPTLPDEINLSYFLPWIFFLPVVDIILKAQQSVAAQGLPFTCRSGVLFFPERPTPSLFMWVVPGLIDNVI